MAENSNLLDFAFNDDQEYDGGSFDGPLEIPTTETQAEGVEAKEAETSTHQSNEDTETPTTTEERETPTGQEGGAPPQPGQPQPKDQQDFIQFNQIMQTYTQPLMQQLQQQNEVIRELQKKVGQPAQSAQPQFVPPTNEEYAADPTGSIMRVAKQVASEMVGATRDEILNEVSSRVESTQNQTKAQQAYQLAVVQVPEISNPQTREGQAFRTLANSPEGKKLMKTAAGPYALALMAREEIRMQNGGNQQSAPDPNVIQNAQNQGANLEASRQQRIKAGQMHSSGKSGNKKMVSLTPEQKAAARSFGLTDEQALAAVGSWNGGL